MVSAKIAEPWLCLLRIQSSVKCELLFVFCWPMRSWVILPNWQLSNGIVLLYDNARQHTARQTQALLREQFHWDIFEHPPYSPDLTPSDFLLFQIMKENLAGKRFANDGNLKVAG